MGSKVTAGRRDWELEPVVPLAATPELPAPPVDPELELEVEAVSAWFEALPSQWKAYFDHEARCGREAYVCL